MTEFLIQGLAVYRLAYMLTSESGPGDVCAKLRSAAKEALGKLSPFG